MVFPNYNFKCRYLYPLLVSALNIVLVFMLLFTINHYFNIVQINLFLIIIIVTFLFEAVIRFNAALEIAIPKLVFLLEAGLYLLFLRFFTKGFGDIGLWVIWGIGLLSWLNIYELTNCFNLFRIDSSKVYGGANGDLGSKDLAGNFNENNEHSENRQKTTKWSFDEFRRLLDYPTIWKKLVGKIYFANIPLMFLWAVQDKVKLWLIIGSIFFLFLEVYLLASFYLDKKTLDWYIEGIERPAMLNQVWYHFFIISLVVVVVFTVVLPYNYSPLPLEKIVQWFNSLVPQLKPEEMPIPEQPSLEVPQSDLTQQPQAAEPGIVQIVFLILQILLGISFLLIILAFILFILRRETKKIGNIPDFFRNFSQYIKSLIKEFLSRSKKLKIRMNSFRQKLKKQREIKKASQKEAFNIRNMKLTGDIPTIISRIYQGMLKLLAFKGEEKKKGQTPYEYSQIIEDKYTEIKDEIRKLTEIYVEVSYSNHKLSDKVGKTAKTLWKALRKKL